MLMLDMMDGATEGAGEYAPMWGSIHCWRLAAL